MDKANYTSILLMKEWLVKPLMILPLYPIKWLGSLCQSREPCAASSRSRGNAGDESTDMLDAVGLWRIMNPYVWGVINMLGKTSGKSLASGTSSTDGRSGT